MPSPPRLWWQDIDPVVWRCFGQQEDLPRERNTAVLAALEELATRTPISTGLLHRHQRDRPRGISGQADRILIVLATGRR
ncbi:hypothetical protein [Micromonospora echinofusca]|uniref:Uncharacterized protein n=1 Tax=Micromonospora echinofusca TaxID=47858 RepID=A0ABS3VUE7_MICEH|nr:hypothetical protein [Micromonospora echinofusca]MBO4208160.1 hypothetical protein [Micromonospora echinofusca]